MVDIKLSLFILQIGRINICDGRVAVPFKESHFRVRCQDVIHYAKHKILYFRIAKIEHQLVTVIVCFAIGQCDSPVRMLLEQFTFGVYHLRFDPDTEFHSGFFGRLHECGNTARQFGFHHFPVAQSGIVAVARMLVAEPAIIQQEHIYTQMFGFFHQFGKQFLIEFEVRIFPVIQ